MGVILIDPYILSNSDGPCLWKPPLGNSANSGNGRFVVVPLQAAVAKDVEEVSMSLRTCGIPLKASIVYKGSMSTMEFL